MENLGKEAGIHQMEDSMFNTADILVYRHPEIHQIFIKSFIFIVGVAVTHKVPA